MKTHVINRYGVTPNDLLNRNDLTLKAKGLYAFMQANQTIGILRLTG